MGPVGTELLASFAANLTAPVWYVAGPVGDVKQTRELLDALGVAPDAIRLEAFRYPGSLSDPGPRVPDWDQLYRSQATELMPWYYPELDPDVAEAIAAHQLGGRALDVGTGPGTQAVALAERGFAATGSDISETAIASARRRAEERGVNARFLVNDVLASKLDERFEVILNRGCSARAPAGAARRLRG